jgi:hypothetical protein
MRNYARDAQFYVSARPKNFGEEVYLLYEFLKLFSAGFIRNYAGDDQFYVSARPKNFRGRNVFVVRFF